MDPNARRQWEEFLDPEVTRSRLISSSIFIAAFEGLKDAIVGRIREFFWLGVDEAGDRFDPKYESDVLSRSKSPVYASLNWLKEMNAITDEDMRAFERVKACRNTLAHDLLSTLESQGLPDDFKKRLDELIALLRKIEVWWITNVELPTNPDYDGSEIDEAGIVPGRLMILQLLWDIALGDQARSKFYLEEFRKRAGDG